MKYNKLFFTIFLSCFLSIFMLTESKAQYNEITKILASDAAVLDNFGYSVSISGDRAIVGASYKDNIRGSAYIFERDGSGNWTQKQKLTASDAAEFDNFGSSVSISGDRAIVGAEGDDDGGINIGSAYIFERDGSGNWTETPKLTASDAAAGEGFGRSVSISEDRVLVGAYGKENFTGSAYIFERDGSGNWTETAILTASDADAFDTFGISVSISGDCAIVGADRNDDAGSGSGSAYIFERDGSGNWTETSNLTASDAATGDYFGHSVSISGDRALVGASYDDDGGINSGSVYMFERDGSGNWTETQKLTASDAAEFEYFGHSVSISGDRAIVGAYSNDDAGSNSGSAYIFEKDESGNWTETQKLTASDAATDSQFGWSVSISGDCAIVGANGKDNFTGSAYIFMQNLSVQDLLSNLISSVDESGIHKGTKNSLISSLENALKSLEKGNTGAAINQLQAFINKVEAQSGKKVDEEHANDLDN